MSPADPWSSIWLAWTSGLSTFDVAFSLTAAISSVALFGASFVYFVVDCSPSLRRYKLQPTKVPTLAFYIKCLKLSLANQVILHAPVLAAIVYFYGDELGTFRVSTPLPSVWQVVVECVGFALCEDCLFYWIHRFLHWKAIYKYVHKVHHEFTAPFGLTAVYTHPAEEFLTMMATLSGPLLFGSHILCLWTWLCLRLVETVDSHSGYEFPFTLSRCIPLQSGPATHDLHHEKYDCNYGSMFPFWDWICGTSASSQARQSAKPRNTAKWSFRPLEVWKSWKMSPKWLQS